MPEKTITDRITGLEKQVARIQELNVSQAAMNKANTREAQKLRHEFNELVEGVGSFIEQASMHMDKLNKRIGTLENNT